MSGTTDDKNTPSLVDELGVRDLRNLIFGKRGRLFSAAGRQTPVAEIHSDFLVLHPPQKPFTDDNPAERIVISVDDAGILLDELGKRKKVSGTKYNGFPIYVLGETIPGTTRHLVAFLDGEKLVKLIFDGQPVSLDHIYKLRIRTPNGELNIFSALQPLI